MYLKRIELFGFKSFADRTELEFKPGVTVVVGPNGSGKSNVADSVRWVLGEQSAKSLRGAKMEDVIFSGSETRKPLSYGEVSLTLDNSDGTLPLDYSEITVTRRVYRSGESEFLINKQACRLKDITELFMDTGLGREAYSIIGQGKIEEILSSKPEDRRGILEEAAGIVKYKNRKKEAVRKLEETEHNLVRIQDIMAEIERQLDPLAQQAEKAKEYKAIREELTGKEIATYVYMLENIHEEWTRLNAQIEELKQEETMLAVQVNELEVEIEKLKWSIHEDEEKLDGWQAELLQLTEELEKVEGQKGVLLERKKHTSTTLRELQEKLDLLSDRKEKLKQEEGIERDKLEKIARAVQETEQHLAALVEEYQQLHPDLEEKIEDLKGDYIELLNEQAALNNERRFYEQTIQQITQKLSHLASEKHHFLEENKAVEEKFTRQQELTRALSETIQQKEAHLIELVSQYERQLERLQKKEEKWRHDHQQLDKLNHRLKFLLDMKADFAGYFQGVKEVLKAREKGLAGIHGAVAELVQVPKKYQLAIEIALGASLQYIVVENEQAAREAIQYLKDNRLGRATFLPLPVLKPKLLSPRELQLLTKADGVIGLAMDLIQYSPQYHNLFSHLLGQVIVTQDLKLANQLARQMGYRYRFVTLDGDLVNPGGSMTGGSVRQTGANLLGRDEEIKELNREIKRGEQALAELNRDMEQEKERIKQQKEAITACQEEIKELKEREVREKAALSDFHYAKERIKERLEVWEKERESLEKEEQDVLAKQQQNKERLLSLGEQINRLEEQIKRLEKEKETRESSLAEKQEEITQLRITLARQKQEYEEKERRVKQLEDQQEEVSMEWDRTTQLLEHLSSDLKHQHQEETGLEADLHKKKAERAELTQLIETTRTKRQEKQHKIEEIEMKLRHFRLEHKQVKEEIHRQEVKANRLDVELENYLTLLREEYELSYELAKERYPLPAPYEQVKKEVEQLKEKLHSLGEVHLGSIEEYQRLNERYQFLSEQEQDLQQAKQSLYELIAEMDETMSQRFHETYLAVREQFQQVFKELFGGGRADLILSEPDNLLTTGLEIIAEPPGKKLQHLDLLSGGERALTAIAILFAILRVKPVPFCILDEVEAALDEANVHRFAQFLKEFSKQTQFIVITHRKGTMEGADVLYGITMQESGVSKLVSVKLEEKESFISA